MAFPVDAARLETDGSTAADPAVVNLVSGITAGQLLIVFFAAENTGVAAGGMPSGWTTLFEDSTSTALTANPPQMSLIYRWADGTEGSSISFDIGSSAKFTGISWRITGAANPSVQVPEVTSMATPGADSDTVDPGSLSPTGGAKDYLWFWLGAWEGEQTDPPAGSPTNYSNPVGAQTGTVGSVASNHRLGAATRQLNAASEDPPSWTISAADAWFAWTLAVHPGADVPTPGGGIASGASPTSSVASSSGGAPAAGTSPTPQAPVTAAGATGGGLQATAIATVAAGGATAGGVAPSEGGGITETPTPGGATAGGIAPAVASLLTSGGATAGGTITVVSSSLASGGVTALGITPVALVPVTTGGSIAGGVAPTEGGGTTETPTPGGAVAGGTAPVVYTVLTSTGAVAVGLGPGALAIVGSFGATSGGVAPSDPNARFQDRNFDTPQPTRDGFDIPIPIGQIG